MLRKTLALWAHQSWKPTTNKYFCSITDLEDDGIDLPDFDDRGCNTLTTIVVSEQDVIDVLNSCWT
jgi:hypothetical protein